MNLAKQPALLSDDEDVHWLARCLDLGRRYAMAIEQLIRLASGRDKADEQNLTQILVDLRQTIASDFSHQPVDLLGGDPGSWLPTLDTLQQLADRFIKRSETTTVMTSDFLDTWQVDHRRRDWTGALCDLSNDFIFHQRVDLSCQMQCAQAMPVTLLLTYDAPIKVSIDGREVWSDPNVSQRKRLTIPTPHDAAVVPFALDAGCHTLTLHCQPDARGFGGFSARFLGHDGNQKDLPVIPGLA